MFNGMDSRAASPR